MCLCEQKGQGVGAYLTRTARGYRPAADQGDAYAQYNLARCYHVRGSCVLLTSDFVMCSEQNGEGVDQDFDEAVRLYRLAADQGHFRAQRSLEALLEIGMCSSSCDSS